jgi:thioredoxin-related protein
MKKLLILSLLIAGSYIARAQELSWTNDITKAIELSKKTKKPLLLFFTGSDWCGWCIRLQNEVFTQPEFAAWANKNVVLVELDFPRRTPLTPELQSQNGQLQQFFQVQGFPTIWFVNATMGNQEIKFEKLGSTGYVAGGPAAWLGVAEQILKNK